MYTTKEGTMRPFDVKLQPQLAIMDSTIKEKSPDPRRYNNMFLHPFLQSTTKRYNFFIITKNFIIDKIHPAYMYFLTKDTCV
jgi:hypothetical protein